MITFLVVLVTSNEIDINKTGLKFLNNLVEIDIFSLTFMCLCFLFIINGSNLIDGFNGLLSIHSLVIFIVLFTINLINANNDLIYILFYVSLLTLIFLKFNFPKAQIFLGDSGAYLIGILIAIFGYKDKYFKPVNFSILFLYITILFIF